MQEKKIIRVTVSMSPDHFERLAKMAEQDRRKLSDFNRILIDQEWERRNARKSEKVAA